ncbi:MAG TPA: hypothetical protein VGG72_22640 [Bryobacteraceae bacterium]
MGASGGRDRTLASTRAEGLTWARLGNFLIESGEWAEACRRSAALRKARLDLRERTQLIEARAARGFVFPGVPCRNSWFTRMAIVVLLSVTAIARKLQLRCQAFKS